jgi:two-component system, cell cycle sensor histidine kinase and response regulator CckA
VAAQAGPIAFLLNDVVMPGTNGKELYERLAAVRPELKVLYMSGYTDDVIAQRGTLDHGVQFKQKPFTVQAFAQKVREVLDRSESG